MGEDKENGEVQRRKDLLRDFEFASRDVAEECDENRRKYPEAHKNLEAIASGLRGGAPVFPVKIRQLLRWFDAERRGPRANHAIRTALAIHDLRIDPNLHEGSFNTTLEFKAGRIPLFPEGYDPQLLEVGRPIDEGTKSVLTQLWLERIIDRLTGWMDEQPGDVTRSEIQAKIDELSKLHISHILKIETPIPTPRNRLPVDDPTLRVNRLKAAKTKPPPISPDDSIIAAATIMNQRGLSRLPVIVRQRYVRGVISWRSISLWLLQGGSGEDQVGRCMELPPRELPSDAPLLKAIDEITNHQYVLIRNTNDNTICGAVAVADLSSELRELSEPYLLLMQIENHIRGLIFSGRFTVEDLRNAKDRRDNNRYIRHVDDLTLGEHLNLLQRKDAWPKLGLPAIHQKAFTVQLDEIKRIRNAIMHFKLDPISDEDLVRLRECAVYLQDVKFWKDIPR